MRNVLVTAAGWLLGILIATPIIVAIVIWTDDPTPPDPVPSNAEVIAEVERLRLALCIALDEAGRDSTSQLDVEACGP